ncbi:Poly [ADP-ribose] polymerase 1, partial [Armadillidium vulgare]
KNNLNVNTPNTPESKLPLAIQDLISLIFDETKMEYTMLEHELDLEKMPLGKLNRKQIEDSFNILSEAMEWTEKLNKKEEREKTKARSSANVEIVTIKNHILDCSNRFYTLIPHNFGFKSPPLLDNENTLSLNEIEIAYNLLKSESMEPKSMHPLDEAYIKLKTDIEVLEKSSDEFKMIHKYFKNTQVFSRFSYYSCDLLQVFKINRHGEEKQFSSFKKLHNRQLLWHGSRLTNFVGILSEGLRTDFSLGNGIYFADMFSKSAGYCHTSVDNPIGLLLLCEVALGEMLELKGGCITKLPSGKHSTKVLGGISPDPAEMMKLDDGLLVPLGIQKPTDVKDAGLFQNEYIVYNSSQIKIKYILQASFRYIINQ